MFTFNMAMCENFALFKDDESKKIVMVESWDNKEFEVSFGTLARVKKIATICPKNQKDLNTTLAELTINL